MLGEVRYREDGKEREREGEIFFCGISCPQSTLHSSHSLDILIPTMVRAIVEQLYCKSHTVSHTVRSTQ